MGQALSEIEAKLTPVPTIATIQGILKSPYADDKCFVIVEGLDDIAFYRRFFDSTKCLVLDSRKDDGKPGGCSYLENVVEEVRSWKVTDKIIGITDADNKPFKKGYAFPEHILRTDHRDLEMTALSKENCKNALSTISMDIISRLKEDEQPLRLLGRMRICNYLFDLGLNINKKIKYTCVIDTLSRSLKRYWKLELYKKFIKEVLRKKDEKDDPIQGKKQFLAIVSWMFFHRYKNVSSFDLCQGHETLKLLAYRYKDEKTFTYKNLWDIAGGAFSLNDFKSTNLYRNLQRWQDSIGLIFLK